VNYNMKISTSNDLRVSFHQILLFKSFVFVKTISSLMIFKRFDIFILEVFKETFSLTSTTRINFKRRPMNSSFKFLFEINIKIKIHKSQVLNLKVRVFKTIKLIQSKIQTMFLWKNKRNSIKTTSVQPCHSLSRNFPSPHHLCFTRTVSVN